MKHRVYWWPIVIFGLVTILNVDVIVLAHLKIERILRIDLLTFFISVVILGTLELCYEYWFIGWCKDMAVQKSRMRLYDKYLKFKNQLELEGIFLDDVIFLLRKNLNKFRIYLRAMRMHHHKLIKWGGYPVLFGISLLPFPGIRTSLLAICRGANFKNGLHVLIVANAIRSAYLLAGFNWLLS